MGAACLMLSRCRWRATVTGWKSEGSQAATPTLRKDACGHRTTMPGAYGPLISDLLFLDRVDLPDALL